MAIFSYIISSHLQEIYIASNSSVYNGAIQLFFTISVSFLNKSIHSSSALSRHGFCSHAVSPWWSGSEGEEHRHQRSTGDTWWPREGGQPGGPPQHTANTVALDLVGLGSATAADLQRGKSPASQLPRETRAATGVVFFIGNE